MHGLYWLFLIFRNLALTCLGILWLTCFLAPEIVLFFLNPIWTAFTSAQMVDNIFANRTGVDWTEPNMFLNASTNKEFSSSSSSWLVSEISIWVCHENICWNQTPVCYVCRLSRQPHSSASRKWIQRLLFINLVTNDLTPEELPAECGPEE